MFYFRENMVTSQNYDLFVNILTYLKTTSDLKWSLKSRGIEQARSLSYYQKKKLLEKNIKIILQKVGNV